MADWPVYGRIDGPIVMIGFGSIGKGTLPLIERHFDHDRSRLVVIDPDDTDRAMVENHGTFVQVALTPENYREVLTPLLTRGGGAGFCVNLSVDTSSLEIMRLCRELGVPYIDTVVEPWPGFYFDQTASAEARTNNALRTTVRDEKAKNPGGTTAISCCGANPGMVSWFVKQALVNLAKDIGHAVKEPAAADREGWARLMRDLGVKGIHIAERDTQRSTRPKPMDVFVNTWSVEGFVSEGMQPAEMGWGTHEKWLPENGRLHKLGAAGRRLPAAARRQYPRADLVPDARRRNTASSSPTTSRFRSRTISPCREGDKVTYRPTCHYAYHPANDAVLSLHEMFGSGELHEKGIISSTRTRSSTASTNSASSSTATRRTPTGTARSSPSRRPAKLAPYQNATGLQVTSAVLAGMVWALENPNAGIVETDEMDYRRCLEVQLPYLGPVKGYYTDWTPLTDRPGFFPEDIDESDPWQFRNVLVR